MRFDLSTFYYVAVGTLLLSAGMTLWERQAQPRRARELRTLAAGYVALAMGCALATARSDLAGAFVPALSNLTILAGYLLVLDGVAWLNGRHYRGLSIGLILTQGGAWAAAGTRWQEGMWSYISAFPIALACCLTAWEMVRRGDLRSLRSRRVVAALSGLHALCYAGRALALPLLTDWYGPGILSLAGKVTMYEGVLYSVALPMALLTLVRDEAHDQLLEASRTDYLTGLGNRRWFFEEGDRLIGATGPGMPMCLLAFDLDHFKGINDRYGHAMGDQVLSLFARIMRSAAPPGVVLARMGGEEFAALMSGHGWADARDFGEAVASRFTEAVGHGTQGLEATVSIGLAELGPDGPGLTELLSAADRALYVAKARGRNRIESAPPPLAAAC